ncbi:hypothetical protein [Butyricimonas paravirosa]|uniref:hypothetical protein n=1 Tax=Butyricimonas paravirosa TaxID=1472417 RepID=UPI0022E8F2CE|nr:hypothetical protein [Butyricimonas paravirosa]
MKKVLKTTSKALLGIIGGIVLWGIEIFIYDLFYFPPEPTTIEDATPVYIAGILITFMCLLLVNTAFGMIYMFINGKKYLLFAVYFVVISYLFMM